MDLASTMQISSSNSQLPSFSNILKLSSDNYPLWKAQIIPYLRSQELYGYVDGSIPAPPPNSDAYPPWLKKDQTAMAILTASLTPPILVQVLECTSSHEIWGHLSDTFSAASVANVMPMGMELGVGSGLGLHFVLVHGFCGGSWCWYKLKCLLESSGHRATSLDLRASGTDPTDVSSVLSFEDYNLPLDRFFAALPDGQKVILVGYSAGGLSVTNQIRKFPHKIHVAVYVAATMLQFGYRTPHDLQIGVPDMLEYGEVFEYPQGNEESPPVSAIFKPDFLRKLVYPMSSAEDFTLAAILSRPGPFRAIVTMADNNNENDAADADDQTMISNLERVRRVYIKTVHDKVMKPRQQEAMIEKWPPHEEYVIDSDHSPFLSNPFVLFGLLLKVAASLP